MDKVIDDLFALAKGMSITFRQLLEKPVTKQYPEEKRQVPNRTRGRHVLHRYADGEERCVGCLLCQGACPASAIYIEAEENDPENPTSKGERFARVFDVDLLRCIYCGHCEFACPTNAITLENNTALAGYSRDSMLMHKEQLLEPEGESTLGTTQYWDPKPPANVADRVPAETGAFDGTATSAAAVGRGDLKLRQNPLPPRKAEKTDA
jgi:NADH-quinone oxidoreductase subunit I